MDTNTPLTIGKWFKNLFWITIFREDKADLGYLFFKQKEY